MSVDDLQAINFSQLTDTLLTLLTDPTSNLKAALLLYSMIGLAVVLVLVVIIAALLGAPEEDEDEYEDGFEVPVAPQPVQEAVAEAAPREPYRPRTAVFTLLAIIGVTLAVWLVAGFTTSADPVCGACHVDTVHDLARGSLPDPHESTDCVSCHEPGGPVGRYFTQVPSRLLHFVEGGTGLSVRATFGQVTPSACNECHAETIKRVTVDRETGVRMSHAEPIAASAKCLDCHVPASGVVSRKTAGMGPCLRCHDSVTASSECTTCHDKQTAAAATARTTKLAKRQVTEVKCGGCHNQEKECDTCHGLRMPHSLAFKADGHARAGAADFWYTGGKTCARCHTPARRPCQKCHSPVLGKGHQLSWAKDHQKGTPASCACHNQMAQTQGRDFCKVCHNATAVEESPR